MEVMMGYQTVVVGYDGSEHAVRAVATAADLVAAGGTVHVVTAFHREPTGDLMRRLEQLPPEYRYVYDPDAAEKDRQYAALVQLQGRGVACKGHVVPDDAATAILDVARREGADLVVVGSRGLGAVTRFLRGSVSSRVAAHAPTSVLVVHEPAAVAPG
ncbi:universal stress protein [Aquipuribacter sp. MA13-6]|uniref:universal stress protein n=1 Tax=unclassified Aquipuribacter TaxID=2635084 RepID=UPI003EF0512D